MGTRLKIEVDLESGSVGSVDDAVRALRGPPTSWPRNAAWTANTVRTAGSAGTT